MTTQKPSHLGPVSDTGRDGREGKNRTRKLIHHPETHRRTVQFRRTTNPISTTTPLRELLPPTVDKRTIENLWFGVYSLKGKIFSDQLILGLSGSMSVPTSEEN